MSFTEKLEKLKVEKQKLIESRLLEIAKLAEKAGVLGIENNLIFAALLLVKEAHEGKSSEVLEDLKTRAKNLPSSRKKSDSKSSKKLASQSTNS